MNAVQTRKPSRQQYRRRILGLGAAGLVGVFAAGAIVTTMQVQDDLERRVFEKFDDNDVLGIRVHFDGQDGTLFCDDGPVEVPADLVQESRDLWGVNSFDVDAACTDDSQADGVDDADIATPPPATETPTTTAAPATTAPPTTEPPPTTSEVEENTILDVLDSDADLSIVRGLINAAGLDATISGDGPFTVFAPTDQAFDVLGSDAIDVLGSDSELLIQVLTHHVTDGTVLSADLEDGDIEMLDGTSVSIDTSNGAVVTSAQSSATVVQADVEASNGVVHSVDAVLLPAGVDVQAADEPLVTATLDAGQITLIGTVASEEQRQLVVAAALAQLDAENVIEELVIDDSSALTNDQAGALGTLITSMPPNMIDGVATATNAGLALSGTYAGADELAALEAGADDADGDGSDDTLAVELDLAERADATSDDAAALEADLNELVAANPILFEQNSTVISDESSAVLDRIAALANRIGGVAIDIEGHTDTDGTAENNQLLSEGRAQSVLDSLVERGIDADSLTPAGFGGSQPILDTDGNEDKAASRRVEFVVAVQT